MTTRPSPGDLLIVDGRASVQFAGGRAMTFCVVTVSDQPTYAGWIWLTGYALDRRGEATAKREIYVQLAGLRPARPPDTTARRAPRSRRASSHARRHDQDSATTGDHSGLHAGADAG
ncbi:hypothetical protein [Micromonospora peucetia]|uniref:Uncharacterized protein n=1 Tax=Micromonospora peucetia TaxID=47871 RepID=A0ABZ1ED87_9ACTN|nr:hypothetical protein [Micromonospora peucetia]WSA31571.1 hypothetical protein OIE14_26125 [Micromonospora peucetia]